jgi:hypothetical protein
VSGLNAARQAVEEWWGDVEYFDLTLPDGWFSGKPYDGFRELTWLTTHGGRLFVEFDEIQLLIFQRPEPPERDGSVLRIPGFAQLLKESRDYATGAPFDVKVWREGEVVFYGSSG